MSRLIFHTRLLADRFVLLALLISPQALAQPMVLNADKAVQMALERPEVATAIRAEIDLARSELLSARTWPNPELSIERTSSGRSGLGEDETQFMLSQRFDLGGRRGLQRHAAAMGLSAAEASAAAEREQLRQAVLQRFYAVVAATDRVEAYRAWSANLDELGRIAARRSAAGDLSGFESGRIRQNVELAGFRLEAAETELLVATDRLASLVGVGSTSIVVDQRESLLPVNSLAAPNDGEDLLTNAELAALDGQRQAAAATAQAAARLSLPVTLGMGQRRLSGPTGSDDALILELSIPLPLFDRNRAAQARAKAESDRAESIYRITLQERQSRLRAVEQEAARLASAARRLETEVLPQARELSAMANSSFAEGELELVELLSVLSAEIDALDQSLDLQYRARLAWIELEQLTQPYSSVTGELP